MPRVTVKEQYRRHVVLYGLWTGFHEIFAVLPPAKQWAVHSYYHTSGQLAEDDFQAHIKTVRDMRPGLVNEAGKGFLEIDRHFSLALQRADTSRRDLEGCVREVIIGARKKYKGVMWYSTNLPPLSLEEEHTVKVKRKPQGKSHNEHTLVAVVRPELDTEQIARILINMAKEMSSFKSKR